MSLLPLTAKQLLGLFCLQQVQSGSTVGKIDLKGNLLSRACRSKTLMSIHTI